MFVNHNCSKSRTNNNAYYGTLGCNKLYLDYIIWFAFIRLKLIRYEKLSMKIVNIVLF